MGNKVNSDRLSNKDLRFIKEVRFQGADFFQAVIGCCVFCLSAFLTPDLWNFIGDIELRNIMTFHLFFVIVVFIAFNYEYASKILLRKLYLFEFCKRMIYVYLSVFFTIVLILFMIKRFSFDMTILMVWQNLFAAQTIGIASAVTFSFLKK